MFDTLINKIGVDKLLHFAFGAVIAFTFTIVTSLQEGVVGNGLWAFPIIGIIVAMILECMKEFVMDEKPDKYDILATFAGAVFTYIPFAVGILFYIWSN